MGFLPHPFLTRCFWYCIVEGVYRDKNVIDREFIICYGHS